MTSLIGLISYQKVINRTLWIATFVIGMGPLGAFADYKALFVFGDSLSDPGNASALTYGNFPPPSSYPLGRFSNGPVAAEYLAWFMKVPTGSFYGNPSATNFAVGGATTGMENYSSIAYGIDLPQFARSGMLNQVHDALDSGSTFHGRTALILLFAGPNDVFLSLLNDPTGSSLQSDLSQAIHNISSEIALLVQKGGRNFLVPNLVNLGNLPWYSSTPYAQLLGGASRAYNDGLSSAMAALARKFGPSVRIRTFDLYNLFEKIEQSPKKFGFTNATTSCLSDGAAPACIGYAFYDGGHPTTSGHRVIARAMVKFLQDNQ